MDEKKNESVLSEEEVTAVEVTDEAPQITAIDENIPETDALQTQQQSPAEVAAAQEGVEAVQAQKEPESEGDAGATGKKPSSKQKKLIIIAAAVLAVAVIVGGVVLAKNIHDTKAKYTMEDGTPTPDSPEAIKEAHGEEAQVITGEDATKGAQVADNDAIAAISELSDKELGIEKAAYIDKKDKEHSFMVAGQSYIIDGEKYVQVIAAEKKENKDKTISITPKAKFYISFDGKTILKENMEKAGTYEKIK